MRFAAKCGMFGFLLGGFLGWAGCFGLGNSPFFSTHDFITFMCVTIGGGAVGSVPGFMFGLAFGKIDGKEKE